MQHGWWSAELGDGMLAAATCERIKDAWYRMRATLGQSTSAAVFTSWITGDLHCNVTAYFSPECAPLAEQFEAVPCPAPERSTLELLAGDPGCWEAMFAER